MKKFDDAFKNSRCHSTTCDCTLFIIADFRFGIIFSIEIVKVKIQFNNDIFQPIFLFSSIPDLLVLNDCDIDCAGEPDELRKKCGTVRELDLAQNKLKSWKEVFSILEHTPRVEFVNLSLNFLSGPVEPPPNFGLTRLRSLVLNNTRLDWESVETLINSLDTLEELHLSLNDYHNVQIDTVDDDVFQEINDYKETDLNDTEENDVEYQAAAIQNSTANNSSDDDKQTKSICSSCGQQTQPKDTKRSKSHKSFTQMITTHFGWLLNAYSCDILQANRYALHLRRQTHTLVYENYSFPAIPCHNGTKFAAWVESSRNWSPWFWRSAR